MTRPDKDSPETGGQLVVLRQVLTRVEADLIEALLRGAGIPCVVHPPPVHDMHLLWQTAPGVITVRVRPQDLSRAEAEIAEQPGPPGSDESGTAETGR
jgi:hypothetical protein